MPTLAFDGSVIYSTSVDRREIVQIAPSYTVSVLMTRAQSLIAAGETHVIDLGDLANDEATNVLLSVSEGTVNVSITDYMGAISVYPVTPSGMFILMNTRVSGMEISASVDSVYDLIYGA
jgi:hypothetical protein